MGEVAMGSKDDDYFVQRAKEGERQVFFAQNSPDSTEWSAEFWKIVKERGLVPIFYDGVGRDYVPKPGMANTLDNEMNEDFFMVKTIVLYFGPARPGKDYEDHWVLPHLKHVRPDRILIVYASSDYPTEILRQYGLKSAPTIVSNKQDFAAALRRDLDKLGVA
jgi:hypothetical protein